MKPVSAPGCVIAEDLGDGWMFVKEMVGDCERSDLVSEEMGRVSAIIDRRILMWVREKISRAWILKRIVW